MEVPQWEVVIKSIAKDITEEQSPARLLKVREKMYELLGHCIPAELILRMLTIELLPKLDAELKQEVVEWASFYEHRVQTGSKAIFHLEAFVAKVMCIHKKFLISLFGY